MEDKADKIMIATGFEFGKLYRHLGSYLAPLATYFRKKPDSKAITATVKEYYTRRPQGVTEQFSPADLCALEYVIQSLKPDKVLELGVASGFTSSFVLNSLKSNISSCPTKPVLPVYSTLKYFSNCDFK